MKKLKEIIKLLLKDAEGQALVLVALAATVLIGFGALTTDIGYLYVQRRQSQNIADAAALAGTWRIQDGETLVKKVVEDYAEINGVDKTDIHPDETGKFIKDNKFVKVVVEKDHQLFLAKIIDIDTAKIKASATATRSSIWSKSHRDLLPVGLTKYEKYFFEEVEVVDDKGKSKKVLQLDSDLEAYLKSIYGDVDVLTKLKTELSVYKKALEYFIDEEPRKFDIVTGDSSYGSFGFLDLDGNNGGGANVLKDWIDNGYNSSLINIISENGNMATLDTNLQNYIDTRGREAFIIAILPNAIDKKPNNWKALPDEYLIIHVKNLKLEGSGGSAKLTGDLVEVMYKEDILLPGDSSSENLPQSWLIN